MSVNAASTELQMLRRRVAELEAQVRAESSCTHGYRRWGAASFGVLTPDLHFESADETYAGLNGWTATQLSGKSIDETAPSLSAQRRRMLDKVHAIRDAVSEDLRLGTEAWRETWHPEWGSEESLVRIHIVAERYGVDHGMLVLLLNRIPAAGVVMDNAAGAILALNRRAIDVLKGVAPAPEWNRILAGWGAVRRVGGGQVPAARSSEPVPGRPSFLVEAQAASHGGSVLVTFGAEEAGGTDPQLQAERFRVALNASPVVVFNQDRDLRYTWIHNPGFGYSPEEVIGRTDMELFDDADLAERVSEIKREVMRTGQGTRREVRVGRSGDSKFYDLTVEPLLYLGDVAGITCAAVEITERRLTEEALRQSEERFRLLAQALPVMVWTARPDGYSDYSNDRWLDYTGQSLEQTYGLGWLRVVHPDDHARIDATWWEAVRQKRAYEIDYRIRRASDGQWRWHLVRAFPAMNSEGEVAKWLGTSTDIHDRFEAEERLQDLASRLRFHVENTPLGVVEFSPDYVVTHWSKRAEELFGWTAEEITGKPIRDIRWVHEEDAARVAALSTEMAAGRALQNVNRNRNYTKDGRVLHCEWYNSARVDADGVLLSVFSLVLDVTERVAGEQALAQSERRFRRLVEKSLFGVALGDFGGGISYANDAFLQMVGYTREDVQQGLVRWTDLTPPEWVELDRRGQEELRSRGFATPFEKEYIRKDGSRVPVLIGAVLLDEPFDQQEQIVGFFMDLTDIKRAQHALERSNDELQRFAYTASHDLQEPIRTVVSFSQLLARQYGDKLTGNAEQYLSLILEASKRMSQLIASLLEYSRVNSSAEAPTTVVAMNSVLDSVLRLMSCSIEESGAAITHDALPEVLGDEQQLMQLLQNLLANAVKYRKPDESPRIHVSVTRHGADWLFCVEDNGLGFKPDYAETIFGVFKRLHGKSYSGTGIGLAICRKIVERHCGRIWAESEDGKGSRFFFTLPVRRRA